MLRDVPEASGLAVSRRDPGVLWTHNDSGNAEELFALDETGAMRGRVRVAVHMRDWEDVSATRCSPSDTAQGRSGDCLYLADIGDNSLTRKSVQVYRVPEPDPGAAQTERPLLFNLSYPDGAHNSEALFVAGGRLFIITRDRTGVIYGTAPLDDARRVVALQRIGQVGLTGVTDAEASSDEMSVVVRTSDEVVIYQTADLIRGGAVPPGRRISIGELREPQGEGVALGDNGKLYLASEGRPWSRAGRFVSLKCGPT
jgi:hypothetical protein